MEVIRMKITPLEESTHQVISVLYTRQNQITPPGVYLTILRQNRYTIHALNVTCDVYEKETNERRRRQDKDKHNTVQRSIQHGMRLQNKSKFILGKPTDTIFRHETKNIRLWKNPIPNQHKIHNQYTFQATAAVTESDTKNVKNVSPTGEMRIPGFEPE